jgi:hypothetical protein
MPAGPKDEPTPTTQLRLVFRLEKLSRVTLSRDFPARCRNIILYSPIDLSRQIVVLADKHRPGGEKNRFDLAGRRCYRQAR